MKKALTWTVMGVLFVALLAPVFVGVASAQLPAPTVPLEGGESLDLNKVEDILNSVAGFIITAGMVIAVIYIIWGGIKWMTAAGNDDKAKEAKLAIWHGVFGAAIVLGVGLILRTIAGIVQTGTLF